MVDPTQSGETYPNRTGPREREYPDQLSDFERELWEQVKLLQISHLEFVLARIDLRVKLRKASVGEIKRCRRRARRRY